MPVLPVRSLLDVIYQLRSPIKFLIYSAILICAFLSEMCHAIELKSLAGKFHVQGKEGNRDIEITYFQDFRFDGVDETFEALKFGDSFISIIKDSRGRSQLAEQRLDAKEAEITKCLDARESQDTVSSQPNAYTRMLLTVKDQNSFVITISYKMGTIPIGPHIDLFPRWNKTPNWVITLTRLLARK